MNTNKQLLALDSKFLVVYGDQKLSLFSRKRLVNQISSGNLLGKELQPSADHSFLLAAPPLTPVEVVLSKIEANLVALVGQCEITLVYLPSWISSSSSADQSNDRNAICRCETLDTSFLSRSAQGKLKILKVAWHPGAEKPPVLTVLTNDNCIRLYNLDAPDRCLQRISFDRSDPSNSTRFSLTIRSGLGESAVSFDFGIPNVCGPSKRRKESASLWPLFVLYGNGDVYSVFTNPKTFRSYEISGPLSMFPPADDNYGVDASSILFLHSAVPLLVIATAYGIQYNCVLLAEEESNENDFALHVYDSVGLELTLSTLCPTTNQLTEDTFSSPCWLRKDDQSSSRYFCCHNAGIHAVSLPWIHDLKTVADSEQSDSISSKETFVEHILCTKPLASSSAKVTLGMIILPTGNSQCRTIITLNRSSKLEFLEVSFGGDFAFDMAISDQLKPAESSDDREFFIDHIRNLLQKTVTNPTLKSDTTNLPPKEILQLLARVTQVLRIEYIDKVMLAKIEVDDRISALQQLKSTQQEHQVKYEKLLTAATNKLERLKGKQSRITEKQMILCERLENLLAKQRSGDVIPSEAEEAALQELETLSKVVNSLQLKITKLDDYVKQVSSESINPLDVLKVPKDQHTKLEKLLQQQSSQIEELVTQVTSLNAC